VQRSVCDPCSSGRAFARSGQANAAPAEVVFASPEQRDASVLGRHPRGGAQPREGGRLVVDFALGKLAKRLSTRSVRLARMILIQAIPNAMVTDVAARNVAGQLRKTREAKAEPLGYQGLYRWDD
jgi:hypothetical protein